MVPDPSPRDAAARLRRASALASRLLTVAFAVALAVRAARPFREFARVALAAQYNHDDWYWLAQGRHLGAMLARQLHVFERFRAEIYRPLFHAVFALLYALFGVDPRPAVALFLAVQVAGNVLLALVLVEAGFAPFAAALAALAGFFSANQLEAFLYQSLQDAHLARLFILATLWLFLRRERPRTAAWLALTLAALGSHEEAAVTPALLALCVWHRDGLAGLRRAAANPAVRGLVVACVGYALVRSALRDWSLDEAHSFRLAAVPFKLRFLRGDVSRLFGGWSVDRGLQFLALFFFPWFGMHGWLPRDLRDVARGTAFGAAFAAVAYLPFVGTTAAGYHFSLALCGFVVPPALLLGTLVGPRRPWFLRAPAMVLALPVVFAFGPTAMRAYGVELARQLHSTPVIRAVRAALVGPQEGGVTRVVFVDAARPSYTESNGPPYLREMSGGGAWNTDDREMRNLALDLSFPGRDARVWVIDPATLPFLCARRGDAVVRVHADWARLHEERYSFDPLPVCHPGGPARVPPALDPATPEGRRTEAAGAGPERDAWLRFLDDARAYWRAYTGRDAAAGVVGRALLDPARGFTTGPLAGPAQAVREAVAATLPRAPRWPPAPPSHAP